MGVTPKSYRGSNSALHLFSAAGAAMGDTAPSIATVGTAIDAAIDKVG